MKKRMLQMLGALRMRRTVLILAGLLCFVAAYSGRARNFFSYEKTEALLSERTRVAVGEAAQQNPADIYLRTMVLEYEFLVDGKKYTTQSNVTFGEEFDYFYPSSVQPTMVVYFNKAFPSLSSPERPLPAESGDMANSLWGIGLILVLLSFRSKGVDVHERVASMDSTKTEPPRWY